MDKAICVVNYGERARLRRPRLVIKFYASQVPSCVENQLLPAGFDLNQGCARSRDLAFVRRVKKHAGCLIFNEM
jgi:hypothetical protein